MSKRLLDDNINSTSSASSEALPSAKKRKDDHDQNMSIFHPIPHHLILNIFDFVLFPLNRYYYISRSDMEKYEDVDFNASFRNWEIREKIGFSKLQNLIFGYFSNDPFRKVQLLFKHLDFDFVNCPYQHSQLVSTMRLNGIKSLIWPTYFIGQCTIVDFPYWDFCPGLENLKFLDVSTKDNYERFLKCGLNLKSVEFEHSDENEEGTPMIYNGNFTEFFGTFSGITSITAHYCGINDKGLLEIISILPNIEKLDVSNNLITEFSIRKLFSLEKIKELKVSTNEIVGADLFSEMKKPIPLRTLDIENVKNGFFKALHEKSSLLPKLTSLRVQIDEHIGEELKVFLQSNSTIKKLDIEGGNEHENFEIIDNPNKLQIEHIGITGYRGGSIDTLLHTPCIKSLSFYTRHQTIMGDLSNSFIERLTLQGEISSEILKLLAQPSSECFPNLNYLSLCYITAENINWKSIAMNRPNLQIEIEDLSGSDESIAELIKLNLLCKVTIFGASYKALTTLKEQHKLKYLRYVLSDAKSIPLLAESSLEQLELPYDSEVSSWGEDEIMDLFDYSSIIHISCVQ
ncbi:predicted protein [Naegleria gruberi]|uniref:Predicted protein n=1 Tax=Naegleria gruberi TaxID=5762 RepID=D2VUF0_NAEGR|nr:uncharacterized protein NAEGRDRAFT_52338 [Naegleria gruberi]EFC39504.1 predicted protein [Naegleria gruberi]|eukprot:XP_002672248.1 predicted protein [Naegleria gruberi strain NEG-M]